MPTRHARITLALLAILTVAGTASAAGLALDWKVTHLSPANGATFYEKSAVTIRCEWSAVITSAGNWDQPVQWAGMFIVDGAAVHYFQVKYDPSGHWYMKPGETGNTDFPWEEKPVYGSATNEFHGAAEAAWPAAGIGSHTIGCKIALPGASNSLESATKTANNNSQTSIVVKAMNAVTPGDFPTKTPTGRVRNTPERAVQPVLPKPSLSIVGAQSKFDSSCASLANLVTVQVKLQNAGMPLAAGKGTVAVNENGGASLSSTPVTLPAFALNEAKVVQLAVGTVAQFAAALAGQHQLRIVLNPQVSGGQPSFSKPATDYVMPLALPSGYCAGK
jgi:hypothetical protein